MPDNPADPQRAADPCTQSKSWRTDCNSQTLPHNACTPDETVPPMAQRMSQRWPQPLPALPVPSASPPRLFRPARPPSGSIGPTEVHFQPSQPNDPQFAHHSRPVIAGKPHSVSQKARKTAPTTHSPLLLTCSLSLPLPHCSTITPVCSSNCRSFVARSEITAIFFTQYGTQTSVGSGIRSS